MSGTDLSRTDRGLICAFDLDGRGGGTELGWEQVLAPAPSGTVRWVHIDFSQPFGRAWLQNDSGIDPMVVEAMLQEDIRPRSLQTPGGILTVLRGVNLNPGSDVEDMVSIRIWLEKDRIISARRRRLMSVQRVADDIRSGQGPRSPGAFLGDLIAYLGDNISEVVDAIDESIEQAELAIASTGLSRRRGVFSNLRRKTAHIRRYLAPQRETLDRLSRVQNLFFASEDLSCLQEETNRMTLFVEELDLARERAMVAQEEILSSLAHEQNSKMYLLSMVAAVFLPLSFLTGLMGMNVAGLPGTENPQAFAILAVLMAGIGVGILLLFRWKKWL